MVFVFLQTFRSYRIVLAFLQLDYLKVLFFLSLYNDLKESSTDNICRKAIELGDADENLEGIYKNIKINFEHLDRYLALMMPLNRRLYREREDIPNSDIKSFLNDLFKNRLERHSIDFRKTNGFSHGHMYGFRSTFYPVFVNIIDNAIYWLSQSEQPNKVIRLHADETGI